MRAAVRISLLLVSLASFASAANITGTVKGPDGSPFRGAFVEAQNSQTRITVSVLSDKTGSYRLPNLPAGQYRFSIRAVGYRADAHTGLSLSADQNASLDFSLQKGTVRWSDLSLYQGVKLLPDSPGKAALTGRCFACHQFQTRMASTTRDQDGWVDRVNFMRSIEHFALAPPRFTEQDAASVAAYLNSVFGENPVVPRSPADLPAYKDTVHSFGDDAMNIVYVEYDMPGPNRMPFSATPDKNGIVWMPFNGDANKLGRLDPKTGHIDEFLAPNQGTAEIHSAFPAADGSVWVAEQASNKLGRWDPQSRQITEFADVYEPGKEGLVDGGAKHTVRVDQRGNAWASGGPGSGPLSRFDAETHKFTHIPDTDDAYGLEIDKDGNCWFAEFKKDGQLGRIDAKTLKVTKWPLPTPDGRPRRMEIDAQGMIWVAEFQGGKIARFDPKTEQFKEWTLPGPAATPYAFGLDGEHKAWYASNSMDLVGRLDPDTGKVTEYPFNYSEITMREFFRDPEGHVWFGSASNNKVGYFYLAK